MIANSLASSDDSPRKDDFLNVIIPVGVLCFAAIAIDVLVSAIIAIVPYMAAAAVAWGVYLLYRYCQGRIAKKVRKSRQPFFPEPQRKVPSRYPAI